MELKVVFKGKSSRLVVPNGSGTSLRDVKGLLLEHYNLVQGEGEYQLKLLYKKLLQNENATLAQVGLDQPKAKLMVLATKMQEVDELIEHTKEAKEKHRLRYSQYSQKKPQINDERTSYVKFGFLRHEVLTEFHEQEVAANLLNRLSADKGIQYIMNKHEWNVGLLKEISPAEFTILGYNKNKGQEIALRLRTNDLRGFRHYNGIRDVLIHELTHMVHSDHNAAFYTLQRELMKEANRHDWNQQKGQVLQPNTMVHSGPYLSHTEADAIFDDEVAGTYRDGVRANGTGAGQSHRHRSDRMVADPKTPSLEERRAILAGAASMRLSEKERALTEGCVSETTKTGKHESKEQGNK